MAIIPQSFYETYLTSAISASATTIPVAVCPASGVTSGFVTIENEIIKFEGNSNPGGAGNLTSCTRGLALSGTAETDASLGAAHAAGQSLKIADVHYYLNNAAAALAITISGTPVANDFARWTDGSTIEGRSYTETKSDLSLGNVEDTALSTWAGTSNITTLGTVGTGTWEGTAINQTYLTGQSGTNTGDESAADLTTAGIIEVATAAETTTGSDATRSVSPDGLAGSTIFGVKAVSLLCVEPDTDVAADTKVAMFSVPAALNGMNLISVHAENGTAGTTGTMDIDVNNNGSSMLSTIITIDSTESGSDTAATPAVINGAADDVSTYDVITIDIDAIQTTAAKGLVVTLEFQLP
jgi:hypothetical protein